MYVAGIAALLVSTTASYGQSGQIYGIFDCTQTAGDSQYYCSNLHLTFASQEECQYRADSINKTALHHMAGRPDVKVWFECFSKPGWAPVN